MSDNRLQTVNGNEKRIVEFITALILTALAYVYFATQCPKPFFTNDEVLFRSIASGDYYGTPDAHLVYIMYPLGLLFKGLYSVSKAINWYGLFSIVMHYVSWFVITFISGSFFKKVYTKIIIEVSVMAALVSIDFNYVLFHQYTDLSAIIFGAGLFLVASAYVGRRVRDNFFGILLLVVSLWLRKEVFFMGTPILALLLIAAFIYSYINKDGSVVKREIVVGTFLGVFAATLFSFLAEAAAYSGSGWKDYKSLNAARTEIVDYYGFRDYEEVKDTVDSLLISREEYDVVSRYEFVLADDFSKDEFVALSDAIDATRYKQPINLEYIKVLILAARDEYEKILHQPVGAVILIAAIGIWIVTRKSTIWFSLASICALSYHTLFTMYFLHKGRFPERVSHGMYLIELCFQFAVFFLSIYLLNAKKKENEIVHSKKLYGVLNIAGLILLIGLSGKLLGTYAGNHYEAAIEDENSWSVYLEESKNLNQYVNSHKDSKYLISGSVGNYMCDRILEPGVKNLENVVFLSYWTKGSPILNEKINALFEGGIYRHLLDKDVRLVVREDTSLDAFGAYFFKNQPDYEFYIEDSIQSEAGKICILATRKKGE